MSVAPRRAQHATTRVLVTGAGGQLGTELAGVLGRLARCEVIAADHRRLDLSRRDDVLIALEELEPDVVLHAGAWTDVDGCESDPDRAFAVNAIGTRHVAEGARRVGAHVCFVSSDYVFDGTLGRPYVEWDEPNPLSVYGRSKLAGERECPEGATVVRTSWVCGRHGANFVHTMLRLAAGDGPVRVVADQLGSPTFTADLAPAIVRLALDRRPGTWHVTNSGETSWHGFAAAVFAPAGADPGRVEPIPTDALDPPRPAPRPARSTLENLSWRLSGLAPLPAWEDGLAALVAELAG